jgi:hypothetical protein
LRQHVYPCPMVSYDGDYRMLLFCFTVLLRISSRL